MVEYMARLSKDDYYLNIAKAVSLRSTCIKRQYGAVIVNHDEIISTGYNGSPRGDVNCCDIGKCDRLNVPHNSGNYNTCKAVHAEQNAIISASRTEMLGGDLYLFGTESNEDIHDIEPCPVCKKMIKNAGIKRIITLGGIINEN
jgi:dCMP deaminase